MLKKSSDARSRHIDKECMNSSDVPCREPEMEARAVLCGVSAGISSRLRTQLSACRCVWFLALKDCFYVLAMIYAVSF